MERLFRTHNIRKSSEIDGTWNFKLEGKEEVLHVVVPSCLETYPGLENYEGKYTYTKIIEAGNNIRLIFKGVSHTADVYLDNEKIAHHYNAFTPFEVVIKDQKEGKHELRVEGDNSYNKDSALHVPNDYFTYGGITRPVILEEVSDAYIEHIQFQPHQNNNLWSADILLYLNNLGQKQEYEIQLYLNETEIVRETYILPEGKSTFLRTIKFDTVTPYELEQPFLYTVTSKLIKDGKAIDDLMDRVGFREIKLKGKDVYFNNKKIHIKGFNRHEDHGMFGCAIPLEAMDYDLRLMKDIGANAVRTSHYPNDERFLDLCDEYGFLVWEESHARGLSEEQMRHPNFRKQSLDCIDEMILNHYNHPTIFTWGILNECASNTEYGREIYIEQFERIKSLDQTRPVTFASCMIKSDLCLDLVDIVSLNIYPQWYFDADVKEYLHEVYQWVQETKGSEKPFIVSEIGAGAIPGYTTHNDVRWSENRQAEILEKQLIPILADENTTGVFIWQFCDCRVPDGGFYGRPRCMNNKGIVDEYRQRKQAYYTVKKIFHEN